MFENISFYIGEMMSNTVPFLLAWEAYVVCILLFFLSIAIRLARLERKINSIMKVHDIKIEDTTLDSITTLTKEVLN